MSTLGTDPVRRTAREAGSAMGYGVALKAIRFAFALATGIIIRRALGPELVGQYGLAQLTLEIAASVASVGMGQAILRFLPELRVGTGESRIRRFLVRALGLQLVGWALCVGIVLALRPILEQWLRGDAIYGLVLIGMYLLGARLIFDVVSQVYYAILDLRPVSIVTVLWQVVFLGAILVLLDRGFGVIGVLVAGALANLIGFAALAFSLRGRLASRAERSVPELPMSRVLRYGLPFAVISLLYNVVWRHSEVVLLNYHWGDAIAGQFFVAYGLPQQILEFVPTAIWPLVMASYAAVFTLDRERARRLVEHYYKLLFLLTVPLSLGGVVLGDRALLVLYGSEYEPGALLTRVFFAVQCVSFLGTPLSMTLYVLEKTWMNLCVWAGAAVVNVGLALILIPIHWRLGSVLPVSLVVVTMPAVFYMLLRRQGYQVRIPWSFLARSYLGSAGLLLMLPLRSWVDGPFRLLAVAALATVLVGAGMKVVRIFRSEEAPLLELLPGRRLRRGAAWFGETS